MGVFQFAIPITYWLLILVWAYILFFCLKQFRRAHAIGALISLLFVVLAIDAVRTLVESLYFGAQYTAALGLLPSAVGEVLRQPYYFIIPKILNLCSAVAIVLIVFYRWLPAEEREEARRQQQQHTLNTLTENQKGMMVELEEKAAALEKSRRAALNMMQDANKQRDQTLDALARLSESERAVRRRAEWAQGLQEAGEKLASCQSVEQVVDATVSAPTVFLGASMAFVSIPNSNGDLELRASSVGVSAGCSDENVCCVGACEKMTLQTKRPQVVPDIAGCPPEPKCLERADQLGFASCCCLPIIVGEECVGLLSVFSDELGQASVVVDGIILLEVFCRQVASVWERCLAEGELHKLSQAITQGPAIVVITDANGVIDYVNPKFTEITGYAREEVVGQNPSLLSSGEQSEMFYRDLWATIKAGEEWRGEICNKRKGGDRYWQSSSISGIRNADGQITHFIAVNEDVTERRQIAQQLLKAKEQAEAATRVKAEFLANMSHEIRTPLNAIIGFAYLMNETELAARQSDYMAKIRSASDTLLGVVNDVLDFSKLEVGKLVIERVVFDLDDVFNHVGNVTALKSQEKRNELVFSIAPDVPRYLTGDPLRLRQVLINLTSNAVKFTAAGKITISCELKGQDQRGVSLSFSVKDTGIGMTEQQQTHLFESFTQGDASTTRKYGGTGLGLAICKNLVNLMGGELEVCSVYGEGSAFTFVLPFEVSEESSNSFSLPYVSAFRVLVVDENEERLAFVRTLLESWQLEVDVSDSASDALDMLRCDEQDFSYKLLIVDYSVAKEPGVDFVEALNSDRGIKERPLTIVMSGYRQGLISRLEADVNVDGVLISPFSRSDIWGSIVRVLDEEEGLELVDGERGGGLRDEREILRDTRVLLVEDNEINQQVAREILESMGVRVSVVDNGKFAVEAAADIRYDAVLMDIHMPDMDGCEATRLIRANEQNASLPILAMTANVFLSDRDKFLSAGMSDYVVKPINPDSLFRKLVKWVVPSADVSRTVEGGGAPVLPVKLKDSQGLVPAIEGVERSLVSLRFADNIQLYRDLLRKFTVNHVTDVDKIRSALKAKDMDFAALLAHTLKGVAGNIGATALQVAGNALELSIERRDFESITSDVEKVAVELKSLVVAITRALPACSPQHVAEASEPLDISVVISKLRDLRGLLKEGDTAAFEIVSQIGEGSKCHKIADGLVEIKELMQSYACDEAAEKVSVLLANLDVGESYAKG